MRQGPCVPLETLVSCSINKRLLVPQLSPKACLAPLLGAYPSALFHGNLGGLLDVFLLHQAHCYSRAFVLQFPLPRIIPRHSVMASGKPPFPESSWGISKCAPHFPARAGFRKVLKEGFPDRSKVTHFRIMCLVKEFSLRSLR